MLESNKITSLTALVDVKSAISKEGNGWCNKIDGFDGVNEIRKTT